MKKAIADVLAAEAFYLIFFNRFHFFYLQKT